MASKPYTVVDITMFNGEVEMLHLRLAELSPLVSKFYITESTITFTGLARDLVIPGLLENDELVKQYADKIIYLPITSQGNTPGEHEMYMRNYPISIVQAAYSCGYNFAISADIDEIPNIDVLGSWLDTNYLYLTDFRHLNMDFYYYSLKWQKQNAWVSAVIVSIQSIRCLHSYRYLLNHTVPRVQADRPNHINNAGWHMSYFMTVEQIQNKLKSFACTWVNIPPYNTPSHIQHALNTGIDLFNRGGGEIMLATPQHALIPKHSYLLSPQFRK